MCWNVIDKYICFGDFERSIDTDTVKYFCINIKYAKLNLTHNQIHLELESPCRAYSWNL